MIRVRRAAMFPVALYALLLVALLGLLRPSLWAPIETALGSVACLPLRALSLVSRGGADPDAEARRRAVDQRVATLWRRVAARDAAPRPAEDAGLVPVPAVVLERRGADARRPPDRLVLSLRHADLAAAAPHVTFGEVLLGFLEPTAVPATDAAGRPDPLAGHAVVRALHHRVPRRVPAKVEIPDQGVLRLLVEPARGADDGLLRCTMFDDHYLAAQIGAGRLAVRTSGLTADPLGVLPAGLTVGTLRVFGYTMPGSDRVVPIDLQVEPPVAPDAVAHAVVWVPAVAPAASAAAIAPDPLAARSRTAVRLQRVAVPTAARHRWLATTIAERFTRLGPGWAVVDGRRLVGVLDAAGFGFGVLAPFGQPERTWSLVIVPADHARGTLPVRARVVERRGALVRLVVAGPTADDVRAALPGEVYTGGDGDAVPPGLWIGSARADGDAGLTVEHLDPDAMPARPEVLGRRGSGDGGLR